MEASNYYRMITDAVKPKLADAYEFTYLFTHPIYLFYCRRGHWTESRRESTDDMARST